ncbi:hypothetical protein FHS29_005284 [Saccharothrix tamanrassetensis]|uniref:Uncharacterized protein n=1 Tax=Saccharothrix tamanrassetensis TaxID=1051531 RepID=A0A841CRS6_9PSEU|nr:hypothetical protein [Saccharothrix tamanrassetensis]MBB5958675.1 hypothetical protein [Saccharothrix tamanrassetensis]
MRASRFLTRPVTGSAAREGEPAVARVAWRRQPPGGTPTRPVKWVPKASGDEQPVTVRSSE